jgi:hypothetical protein
VFVQLFVLQSFQIKFSIILFSKLRFSNSFKLSSLIIPFPPKTSDYTLLFQFSLVFHSDLHHILVAFVQICYSELLVVLVFLVTYFSYCVRYSALDCSIDGYSINQVCSLVLLEKGHHESQFTTLKRKMIGRIMFRLTKEA